MQRLDYLDKNFMEKAWLMANNSDCFEIAISEKLALRTEKALDAWMQYHKLQKNGTKSWQMLTKLAWFGIWTPVLWGVINRAELHGLKISSWAYEQHQLIIRIER
jgi:hypothetical protein